MPGVYRVIPVKKRSIFNLLNFSITSQLIFLNILLSVLFWIAHLFWDGQVLRTFFALMPSYILSGQYLWTLGTSMFLHGSLFHLFANMFSLFFIGKFLENLIGKKRFLWLYIISGLIAGLTYSFLAYYFGVSFIGISLFGTPQTFALGASGAIFGLLGVLAVLVPYSKIYLIVGPLILMILDAIFGNTFSWFSSLVNILIILMIFSLFSFNSSFRKFVIPVELPMWVCPIAAIVPLVIIGFRYSLPIGNSAHFGGLVVGLIYGLYLRKKFPNKTKRIAGYFK
jgi:membrane associated rhomboid family serine protease